MVTAATVTSVDDTLFDRKIAIACEGLRCLKPTTLKSSKYQIQSIA